MDGWVFATVAEPSEIRNVPGVVWALFHRDSMVGHVEIAWLRSMVDVPTMVFATTVVGSSLSDSPISGSVVRGGTTTDARVFGFGMDNASADGMVLMVRWWNGILPNGRIAGDVRTSKSAGVEETWTVMEPLGVLLCQGAWKWELPPGWSPP